MKTTLIVGMVSLLLSISSQAKEVEQTICFSQASCTQKFTVGSVGDGVQICGGKCQGRTLSEMNRDGWTLTEVITGLNMAFGMVFTREK